MIIWLMWFVLGIVFEIVMLLGVWFFIDTVKENWRVSLIGLAAAVGGWFPTIHFLSKALAG